MLEGESFDFYTAHLVRYSGSSSKNAWKEFRQRIRKLMTMHPVLHPKDDKERKKKEEFLVDSVVAKIQVLMNYTKKSKERRITAASNSDGHIIIS